MPQNQNLSLFVRWIKPLLCLVLSSFFLRWIYIYIYIFFLLSSPLNSALNCCCCLLFSDNIEVALLRTLTKEDLLTFYKVYICTQTYNCLMKRMLPDETLMWSVSNTSITWKHETRKPVDSPTLVSTFSQCELLSHERRLQLYKGRFTRCNLLYDTLTTQKSCRILKHVLKPDDNCGLKSVVRRLHATKSYLVNRP